MEFGSERSSHGGDHAIKDEKRSESSVGGDDEDRPKQETAIEEPPMTNSEKSKLEPVPISASSTKKEEVDELENAKAEMGEVREENQRLKMCLDRILNDYRTLQMQFHNIIQQETKNPPADNKVNEIDHNQQETLEESELVSLSLGRLPSNPRSHEKAKVSKPRSHEKAIASKPLKEAEYKEGLALGLDSKYEKSKSESTTEHVANPSPTNSSEAPKEEARETWPPSKVLKTTREDAGEDELSQHNPAKKARVCVRARCDTPTMNDGCQWRKYGQKISKGNPCPRAYYRCTVAPSCPVRKQVQRFAQDMSILITTYEGDHNHPLPLSATAMASTTSAAASMLLSGSSTSHSASIPSSLAATSSTTAANLHGMNFYLSDGSKSKQFFLSHPALSSSPSHPTITLDLTSNPSSSSSAPFGRFNSNYNPPRYPSSTSLNFSSSESNAISWGNNNGFLSYNNIPSQTFNNRNVLSTINLARSQPMENIYHSFMQMNNNSNVPFPSQEAQHSLPDTIAAATKVITADPNFQSALATAITSIISTGSSGTLSTQGIQGSSVGENLGQKMKWGELFQASNNSALPSTSKANIGCASSFLNKAAPANTQNGSLVFLPPSLPLSSTKSASGSPGDNRDNTN